VESRKTSPRPQHHPLEKTTVPPNHHRVKQDTEPFCSDRPRTKPRQDSFRDRPNDAPFQAAAPRQVPGSALRGTQQRTKSSQQQPTSSNNTGARPFPQQNARQRQPQQDLPTRNRPRTQPVRDTAPEPLRPQPQPQAPARDKTPPTARRRSPQTPLHGQVSDVDPFSRRSRNAVATATKTRAGVPPSAKDAPRQRTSLFRRNKPKELEKGRSREAGEYQQPAKRVILPLVPFRPRACRQPAPQTKTPMPSADRRKLPRTLLGPAAANERCTPQIVSGSPQNV